jgi:hypothetical protein
MRSLGVAAFLIAAGFGPTAAYAGEWLTDPKSACTVWDALPVPDETVGWTGECTNGKASGPGVLTIFKAGDLIERNEGEFVDGKQTGHGARRNPKGRYVGNFKDGLFDGQGVYVGSSGMRYDGEWKNGNLEGHGKLIFSSGLRYEGQFRANTYSGSGSMTFPDGARYDGEYLLSTPHGSGVYKNANGSIYAGQWSHGCFREGSRTMHLGVFAEDCGLSADAAVAHTPPSDPHDSRAN